MKTPCECEHTHAPVHDGEATDLGVDERNGRFGQVTLHRCPGCATHWLHYLVDYEAFARSGRWFCGRVDEATARTVLASNAVATLAGLAWYWAGGSYFDGELAKSSGPVPVDLYGPPAVE